MLRFLFESILLFIFFAVVRVTISWAVRFFAAGIQRGAAPPERRSEEPANTGALRSAGELQKDPVCGTFVHAGTSLKLMVAGHPVYFCSRECRDRY